MTVIDKPEWVTHNGTPIWSIDVDHEGKRLATSGQDCRIRIWNLAPILHASIELDNSAPKALATICDHQGSVNVVRFSPKGNYLASGSDDKLVVIHKLMPGQAKAVFGMKEAPSVENWRQVLVMRGHSSDVSDLSWCPDGTKLASCSIGNAVIVWDATNGKQIANLTDHRGAVKGVAWDPFNRYLAAQGESDGIVVWSTADWRVISRIEDPYRNAAATNTFHYRLAWSPDGQTLTGVNAFSQPVHQAPLIKRNEWTCENQLCGHRAAICVARWNPKLFCSKEGAQDEAVPLCAIGSADRMFSVWALNNPKPILIGSQCFKGCVMDLAWTPDGHTLIACSYDGTVMTAQFTEAETGKKLPESEMQQLIQQLYGDQQTHGAALAMDYEVLASQQQQQLRERHQATTPVRPGGNGSGMQAIAARPAAAPVPAKAGLDARLGPGGHALSSLATNGTAAVNVTGRKRVAPQLVGDSQAPTSTGPSTISTTSALTQQPPPPARQTDNQMPAAKRMAALPVSQPTKPTNVQPSTQQPMVQAGPTGSLQAAVQPPQPTTVLIPALRIQTHLHIQLGTLQAAPGRLQPEVLTLEATNNLRDAAGSPYSKIQCASSGRTRWFDSIEGSVVQMVGTLHYCAVATSSGDLVVFSAAGRRLLPPLCLGATAAFMVHDDEWLLLVLTADGKLRVWDIQRCACTLDISTQPLLANNKAEVTSVKLSSAGVPLIVLSNRNAYAYMESMQTWARVADHSFAASHFHSSVTGAQGDLGRLQSEAASTRQPAGVFAAALQPADMQKRAARAHLETCMASALALKSPSEWKRWLTTYTRVIALDQDEARLRELIHDLLGPVRWTPATHPTSHQHDQLQRAEGGSWSPTILGFSKRSLLRNEIYREIARARSPLAQKLAAEILDLLAEADKSWQQQDQDEYMQEQQYAPGIENGQQAGIASKVQNVVGMPHMLQQTGVTGIRVPGS